MAGGAERAGDGLPRAPDGLSRPERANLPSDWFRTLIEQLPVTVYVDRLDELSSNVYTSPQLEAVLGYTVAEWAEDEDLFLKVVHPEDRERVLAEHRRTRDTGEPFSLEYRMIARDGRVVWFLDQATVISDETGRPAFHHGFLLDITERKELEEALRRSEAEVREQKHHLESLLQISPTAIITLDREGSVTSWNLAAEDLFGYETGEAIGRDLADLVAGRDDLHTEATNYRAELVRTGRFQAVTRRARKDGSLVDVELFAVPIGTEADPAGSLVVYRDVTALRAQQEAEKRYRELIEQLPLVTYVDEPTAAAASIYISPQVEELLGYSPEEWLSNPELFPTLLHPDDRDRVLADHERVFASGETNWCFEYRLLARDGRTVWLRDEAVVVHDDAGAPLYVQGFLVDVTERKEAEELLRASEKRFRAMFEEAPIGIAWGTLDADAAVVPTSLRRADGGGAYRRNRAYREMLGYSEAELDTLHFSEYTHPEDLPRELELHRDLVAGTSDRYELEKRYIRRDGRVIWAHVVESVVRDDAGNPLLGLTMVEDVTQRREAEEALRESEAELRRQMQYLQSLLEISPTAVVTLDLEERVTSWNPAAEALFGYTLAEAVGQPIKDLLLRLDALHEEGDAIMVEAIEHGAAQLLTRRTRKDGTLVDVEVLVVPLHVDGAHVGYYVIYHDVSALQRQKHFFQSLLDNSPTAIAGADLEGRVTAWNPAAEGLFGYTREEAIGALIDDLVANSDEIRAEAIDLTQVVAETGELHRLTQRTRKDGSLVDVELFIAPVLIADKIQGFFAIYHDIGELQRARREAEAANRAKSAFLATMSHEIRTPMNAVIGMTGLLLDTDLDPEQREFAEIVRTSGEALLTIIDDILDFSKIEAGKLELEHRPLDVRTCVEAALDVAAPRATEKGLDLVYLVDPDAPRAIIGDVTRLRQILINLVSNAVKFTETGEVVVSVDAKPADDGHAQLHFAVRDTGIGIPPERIGHLFESFSQVDTSTTRRYGGTGLGLAISKRLVEMMGGTMWAESEVGRGSTFHFEILAEEAPAPVPSYDAETQPELAGKRLLIVDDNEANRTLLVRRAHSWGMLASATASPAEALSWLDRGDLFDAALLDLRMPDIDGIELARRIRTHGRGTFPLVLLTSLGLRREDAKAGVDFAAHLAKPVKASQLYETLVNVFAAQAIPAPPAAAARGEAAPARALRVLLVEDNEVNRKLALALLAKLGYGADVARNGVEALAALEKAAYDAVLMDVEMPEMDGLEATRRIRERWHGTRGPRIIAMTAKAMQGDREACLAAGMDDYLTKPIRVEELERALARSEPRAEVAQAAAGDGQVLEPSALEDLQTMVGDPAFVSELIATFLSEAPGLVAALQRARASGDAEELRRAAHTLKSNGRTFGANRFADACQELEERADAGDLDAAAALVDGIEAEYRRVEEALATVGREAT